MLARLISILIGYICGHFLTGFFYGKTKNVDLRQVGSGNVGTTNTYRNLGPKAGILTFFGDVFKVVLAVLITWLIYRSQEAVNVRVLMYYAAVGTVLGHNFPVFMKFHGGKGIACTGGLMLAVCPLCVPICLILFIVTLAITKYVSLGSIFVCLSFFIQTIIFGQMGLIQATGADLIEIYALSAFVMLLGIVRHHANIGRLMKGTESKFELKPKTTVGK